MKRTIKQGIFILLLLTGFLAACEKDDSKSDFGFTKIYMPQAMVTGGINNNYFVPRGISPLNYNFKVEGGTVKVILGVLRSGNHEMSSFDVNVVSRVDTVSQIIQSGQHGSAAIAMPTDLYSLPSQVSVPGNSVETTFYLNLDLAKLKTYTGKKLILAVALQNPSKYELNPAISTTIVIVNTDELLNIIK